ncbi:acyl-CoA synthetase [Ottowia thiooxydans]|uniref:acyl-CoA synthetase n=1 Tax=Ottowia thiooxydans TaxID=219182 RepID=UPI000405381D|nr:AMP-binding protein [Ottowia thiooxydans]
MQIPTMHDYRRTVEQFRWELPSHFNFGRDVVDHFAAGEDRLALIASRDDGTVSRYRFSDIARASAQIASVLRRGGVVAGDRVLVQLPRIAQWHMVMTACAKLGAVPVPCVEMLTEKDVAYRIQHAGAVAAVTTPNNVHKYATGCERLQLRLCTEPAPGWLSLGDEMARESTDFACHNTPIEAPAIIYYTSGSSGMPKGVTHAARGLFAWRLSAAYWQELSPGDVNWCTADTGWAKSGTGVLYAPWSRGATVVIHDGAFDPVSRLQNMAKLGVTVFCAAATEFRHFLQCDLGAHNLSQLRLCVSAGESVNPEVIQRWRAGTGVPLLDGYGQTETLMTILNYSCLPVKPGSMGKPIPGTTFDVLDEHNSPVPMGEVGRIAMKLPNPQFMLGYWDDPMRTQEGIAKVDGADYWITGDLGYCDKDGYFFYTGRDDDIIKSSGYRIGPMEVENALMEHPAVLETAVIGVPDAERGAIVKAFVVLRAEERGSPELAAELQAYVKRVTAPYKYPREIAFCETLPKSAAGKVLRRVLRDQEAQRHAGDMEQKGNNSGR